MESLSDNDFSSSTSSSNNNDDNDNNSGDSGGNMSATAPLISSFTPEAVQQAAAALDIPWSNVEQAILAQSLLASLPLTSPTLALRQPGTPLATLLLAQLATGIPFPFPSTTTAATTTNTTATNMIPNHIASINIAHDNSMDISPPCTPLVPLSPSPLLPLSLQFPTEQSHVPSTTPHPLPTTTTTTTTTSLTTPSTSRRSILSSTQIQLPPMPGSSKPIQATTYKSTYRAASLFKRNREQEEPPSVLEGMDLTDLDETTLKRAKNTDAARRSRHKKQIHMESLEQRVAELEVENSMFESKLNEVELERSLLADKGRIQQARIQELEFILSAIRKGGVQQ
ncbi:MAG: hypothetical protein J3Q66DRAFT_384484 [Benniella sp.]|nr:MAG: hypothetical protein J3Q66DRAFT_384484 [Benniella sp.]